MNAKIKKSKNPQELANALGLTPADALEWEVRHLVTQRIIEVFKASSLTITKLAKDSGTSRARITNILKADCYGISLDVLFRVLGATGQQVHLSFKKTA